MIGQLLGNRYQVISQVGLGGMATVYKAEDILLKRSVAVKILKQQFVEDDEFLRKFEMEAQSAASLSHPNIVNVYDVGTDEIDGKKVHYIIMELMEGVTLKDFIENNGPLTVNQVVDYSYQIAEALDCAHKKGIIHRDIKPQNILMNHNGVLKVTDFGIARISSSATLTYTSTILGTVHYISPEQAKGKFIDEKSDIYSLGVVMYEMCTGRVPFDAENAVGIAIKHIQEEVVPPKEINPEISEGLNAIVLRCLQKEPIDRFQNAASLAMTLRDYESLDQTVLMKAVVPDQMTKTSKIEAIPKEPVEHKVEIDNTKAVYRTPDPVVEEPEKKKKKGSSIVLPVLLGLLLAIGLFWGYRTFFAKKQVVLIPVPDVRGQSESVAINTLRDAELKFEAKERQPSSEVPAGFVISQTPEPPEQVAKGTVVKLVISSGDEMVVVPNFSDKTASEIELELHNLGLKGTVTYDHSSTVEKDKMISQSLAAGVSVTKGSEITIKISRGKKVKTVEVPDLVGKPQVDALRELTNAGLAIGKSTTEFSDTYASDQVSWQSYKAGVSVEEGTVVDIIVSKGAEPPEVATPTEPVTPSNPTHGANKKYQFTLNPPTDRESFHVTIMKTDGNRVVSEAYNKVHQTSEGVVTVDLVEPSDSKFQIFYDGTLVESVPQE